MATSPAAGWYPDPASPSSSRWWDGSAWTDHVQPAAVAAVPMAAPVSAAAPVADPVVATAPARSSNLDADGVPLSLFADSTVNPAVLAPSSRPATQEDWHNQAGRGSNVRRQVAGSVSLSTAGASSARTTDPYDRNWVVGLAVVLAVLSIPALFLRVAWDFPTITQSILGGAPIAISVLALAMSIRRGRGIALSIVAVLISVLVLVAGLVVDPAILTGIFDTVRGLLPF
jgi:hypothetical protein